MDDPAARLAWLTPDAARALEIPVPASGVLSPGYRVHISGQAVDVAGIVTVSVQARTAEIALRRAIGSPRALIARLFLLEGILIGTVGGAMGAAVGSAAVLAVSASRGWTAVLPPTVVPAALALGVTAGTVSALYPAWVASRQHPADALRG